MATKRNSWSEAIHARVISLIEEFTHSFGNSGGFKPNYSITKNRTFSTFLGLKFTHIQKHKTLSSMKFNLTIRNDNDIVILQSLLTTIQDECDKIISKSRQSDDDN